MTIPKISLDKTAVARLLNDVATLGTTLHVICLTAYGEEIYTLDILELLARLREDFGVELPEDNENKLQAMLTAVSTEAFHQDVQAFNTICNTLSSGDPGLDELDDVTLPEMLWAMFEVEVNRGPDEFSPSVQARLEQILASEMDPESDPNPYRYASGFVEDQHALLMDQMVLLGIPAEAVPKLPAPEAWAPDPAPLQ